MKNIAKRDYEHYKARYQNTVPIRGRTIDLRPIGDRKRTNELITRKPLLTGEVSYCAKLYGTEVVEYHNNGWVILRTNKWQTSSTADFMHTHSPFTVSKVDSKLWAQIRTPEGVKAIPIGDELTLEMVPSADGHTYYQPINKVLINKKVVDRAKAKAAREPMKPFMQWSKAFLAMGEGWIMHATRKEAIPFWQKFPDSAPVFVEPFVTRDRELYAALCNADPEDYLTLLCCVLSESVTASHSIVSERVEVSSPSGIVRYKTYCNRQYTYATFHKEVYRLADMYGDIYKTIEVELSDKPLYGTV
jgi:hypothetical protein